MPIHALKKLLAKGPVVMGIVNVTPDSFSDGGQCLDPSDALSQAELFIEQGADILDIGGESSRPGAKSVSLSKELDRVVPIIECIHRAFPDILISVDTYKAQVMAAACDAGAGMINDIYALRQPGALDVACAYKVPVCLMHMKGVPETMQDMATYSPENCDESGHIEPVVRQVKQFMSDRIEACLRAGISKEQLCIDPGFGFGKTLDHNMALLRSLKTFTMLDCPVLVGVSRKSMIGSLLNRPIQERLAGGLAMGYFALNQGASIIRTHDVAQTVDMLKTWKALSLSEC